MCPLGSAAGTLSHTNLMPQILNKISNSDKSDKKGIREASSYLGAEMGQDSGQVWIPVSLGFLGLLSGIQGQTRGASHPVLFLGRL